MHIVDILLVILFVSSLKVAQTVPYSTIVMVKKKDVERGTVVWERNINLSIEA